MLSSEVENILNGTVERKVNADKAIGVSDANLKPDENGEVPLSKQGAFVMAPTPVLEQAPVEETPVLVNPVAEAAQVESAPVTATPVEPTMPEAPVAPVVETPAPAEAPIPVETATPVEEPLPETPALDAVPIDTPEAPQVPTEEVVDALAATPFTEPVATEAPVETAAPVEETIEDLSLPQDDIITEAPISVADTSSLEGFDVKGMIPDINIPEPPTVPVEEKTEELEMPEMPEVLAQEPTEASSDLFADETPVLPVTPEEPVETAVETPEVGAAIENPLAQEMPTEVLGEETATIDGAETSPEVFEETSTGNEQTKTSIFEEEYRNEKLDEIIDKLNSIDESLKDLNAKLELKNLEVPTMEEMSAPVMEPVMEPVVAPVAEQVVEPVTQPVMDAPEVAEPEIPGVGGLDPLPAQPMGEPVAEAPQNDGEMVDALSQLPNVLDEAIDETPIQGGMFI